MIDNQKKDRFSLFIDYAKALGIMAVVLGHLPNVPMNTFTFFNPYMYHMPLFFFIGGMLFKPGKPLKVVSIKLLKEYILYTAIVFILIGLISIVSSKLFLVNLSNPFSGGIISSVKDAFANNMHNNKLFLVAWFLVAYAIVYFTSNIITTITKVLMKDERYAYIIISFISGVLAIVFLPDLYASTKSQIINLLCQVLVGMMFYASGYLIKNIEFKIINTYGFMFCFSVVVFLVKLGVLSMLVMSWSSYPNGVIVSLIGAYCGIYCVLYFAKLLSYTEANKFIKLIGSSSKSIMSWHLVIFMLLDIALSKMGYFDIAKYTAKGYKVYNNQNFWLLYVFAGLIIPVVSNKLYSQLKSFILNKSSSLLTQR